MRYKTIVLELLQQQRTELYTQLRKEHNILIAIDIYARQLKKNHEAWMAIIAQANPGSDPSQISSEALEMALKELEDRLPPATLTTG